MGSGNGEVIDLTDDTLHGNANDEDDEDLRKAIALSLESMPNESVSKSQKPTTMSYGIPGMDRRQQEQDRLARLKRKRDGAISPPPIHRTSSMPPRTTPSLTQAPSMPMDLPRVEAKINKSNPSGPLAYAGGAVKKTWAFGFPRNQDVKLEEILQASSLQAAVLSSFQWDTEWLFSKLDTARTKFVLVMQAKGEAIKEQYRQDTMSMPNLRLCFPSMEGQVNCMHSKLMLLFHPAHLRIVVPTANLVPYDWGEKGGFMENMLFVIDLPLLDKSSANQSTPFKEQLMSFLEAQGMYKDVLGKLGLFDFSKTNDYAFVHTIGGSHHEPHLRTTGICGLGRSVKTLALATTNGIQIDYITSSVGSLNWDFLRSIYQAAQGDDGYSAVKTEGFKRSRKGSSEGALESGWKQNFRCYFPSDDTVMRSKSGPAGAGTVCFQEDWWNKAGFPREIMHDCISSRPGMLMHNKVMYVRPQKQAKSNLASPTPSWAYLGSANLSESAWGKVVLDRSAKAPKLNCRNWECGVVVPLQKMMDHQADTHVHATDDLREQGGDFPIPMQLPSPKLSTRRPWFFMSR